MILALLLPVAHAASCCSTVGAQATTLASCDTLGVVIGGGGSADFGGWGWDGGWTPVGDDGGGSASVSFAVMGRFTPWLQGGFRFPVTMLVDRLDGVSTTDFGVGEGLAWVDLETPAGWPGTRTPRLALEVGLGTEGPSGMSPGAKVAQVALRASKVAGAWGGWATASGRVAIIGVATPDGDASLVVDRALGARTRLGVGLAAQATAGALPALATSFGPTLTLSPTASDTVMLSVRTALPVGDLGRNTASSFVATLDWQHVIDRRSDGG